MPDTARTIEDLVAKARQADAEVAAARADAVPAGDADPYRPPAAGGETTTSPTTISTPGDPDTDGGDGPLGITRPAGASGARYSRS